MQLLIPATLFTLMVALGLGLQGEAVARLIKSQDLLDIGRQPDAILTDYRLRDGRTGVEAIAELRTTFGPHIPAALITGDTASTTGITVRRPMLA